MGVRRGQGYNVPKDRLAPPVAVAEPVPSSEPVAQWGDPRVKIVYDLICDCDGPTDPEEHWEGWVARRIVDALATLPAPQAVEPINRAIEWLRNNYQDHANIADLCDAMRDALAAGPATPAAEPISEAAMAAKVYGQGPWRVTVIESERGWGKKVDEYRRFPTKEEAEAWAKEFNKRNTASTAPDWYMQAESPRYVP